MYFQDIMLYILNFYNVICQLHINKTGKNKQRHQIGLLLSRDRKCQSQGILATYEKSNDIISNFFQLDS